MPVRFGFKEGSALNRIVIGLSKLFKLVTLPSFPTIDKLKLITLPEILIFACVEDCLIARRLLASDSDKRVMINSIVLSRLASAEYLSVNCLSNSAGTSNVNEPV
ncbi:hypothetical protein D3C71_1700540 [compost metagenome]